MYSIQISLPERLSCATRLRIYSFRPKKQVNLIKLYIYYLIWEAFEVLFTLALYLQHRRPCNTHLFHYVDQRSKTLNGWCHAPSARARRSQHGTMSWHHDQDARMELRRMGTLDGYY